MKWMSLSGTLLPVLTLVLLLCLDAPAQAPAAAAPASPVTIRKISGSKQQTPEYMLRKSQFAARTREWFQVVTTYDTEPDWIDEAVFTYYILCKARAPTPGKSPFTLFKGSVTYVNIQKGRHQSDMFLHPSTLARFGDVERVAVQVNVGGRLVAMDGLPTGTAASRWWEQLSPVEGHVLNRLETPFAMLFFDDYEAIKPK